MGGDMKDVPYVLGHTANPLRNPLCLNGFLGLPPVRSG
jgi:hypothetical protein